MKKTVLLLMVAALGPTAEVANADFTFGTPTKLGPNINTSSEEFNASISADGLSLYFISSRSGGIGMHDIWVSTRATTEDGWGGPVNLGPTINTPAGEWGVSISHDELSLYFDTRQSGTTNAIDDLWVATRATRDDDWSNPVSLGAKVNSGGDDYTPSISADGLALYFSSNRGGGYGLYDIWVTKRETIHDPWGAPENLGTTINSSVYELDPGISPDGRVLFFTRTPGGTETNIWMTWRATTDDPWGEPVNLGPTINSSAWEGFPNVSADGSTLFFRRSFSARNSGGDIWQAPIIPIIDYNADGIVDAADMCVIIDYWGTDEPLCDIGPMPWGDGIVDVEDLKVLAEHLFTFPGAVAYWKLDETEGDIAYDSAAVNDAVVFGGAVWQPAGGVVDGALELEGIDDYVSTPDVLNPAGGPFSIFAWITGGAPGQVILSESAGANWLAADAEGKLMTELKCYGRTGGPLQSQVVITEGQWHRIGLVWDGSRRTLFVDGVMAAEDTQASLPGSSNGLYIGAGSGLELGTFWSGLIDDVRIYSRVVKP